LSGVKAKQKLAMERLTKLNQSQEILEAEGSATGGDDEEGVGWCQAGPTEWH
jgi:hypothetical protein